MTWIEPLTVAGIPLKDDYALVLAHEHLVCDITCWLDTSHEPTAHLQHEAVTPENLPDVQGNPFACADNLRIEDVDLVAEEVSALSEFPGSSLIVDLTLDSIGRDAPAIESISERTGVDVVFGCGRYVAESRPDDSPATAPEFYRDEIRDEFSRPAPRPSVIGEIGTGDPIVEVERNALIGASMAQAELGAPVYVHLHPWARHGHEALDLVEEGGGSLESTILCHLDPQIPGGLDYHRSLMDRGATISFDLWGDEMAYGALSMPTDAERIEALCELIQDGYGDRIVHSHDICTKTQLKSFQGPGYAHLPGKVAEMMSEAGLSDEEIHRQLAGNALDLIKTKKGAPR